MNEKYEKHLATMLEGYERSLQGVDEFLDNSTKQMEAASSQREEIVQNIAELKDILGIDEEVEEDSPLKLVADEVEA